MKILPAAGDIAKVDADAAVVGVYFDAAPTGHLAALDAATGGLVSDLIKHREVIGKKYELVQLVAPHGVASPLVILVGLGVRELFDAGGALRTAAAAARMLSAKSRRSVAFYFDAAGQEICEAGICGAMLGSQGQDLYRAEKIRHPFETILWAGAEKATAQRGAILGDNINLARRLINSSPDEIYPAAFAEQASAVAAECGLDIEIWDQAKLEQERCGSLLAVAKGSSREPRIVILRYKGGPGPMLGIVGKGVTFDSGGLSLKPAEGMLTMKCDMAGAATMLAAMRAIAQLKLPISVVGLTGLVENMTGPAAMKVGDVLTARNGRTIEVLNTDAEGRLVLADVLSVALEQKVSKIVDLATLTGACVVALGTEVAGILTNNQPWCDEVTAAAARAGEPLWQLPMFPDIYDDLIRSEVADIKNVGEGRYGGAISAAKFLEQFVEKVPWAHLDIAGPAFRDKPKPWCDAGASGTYVRTLVELARRWNA